MPIASIPLAFTCASATWVILEMVATVLISTNARPIFMTAIRWLTVRITPEPFFASAGVVLSETDDHAFLSLKNVSQMVLAVRFFKSRQTAQSVVGLSTFFYSIQAQVTPLLPNLPVGSRRCRLLSFPRRYLKSNFLTLKKWVIASFTSMGCDNGDRSRDVKFIFEGEWRCAYVNGLWRLLNACLRSKLVSLTASECY